MKKSPEAVVHRLPNPRFSIPEPAPATTYCKSMCGTARLRWSSWPGQIFGGARPILQQVRDANFCRGVRRSRPDITAGYLHYRIERRRSRSSRGRHENLSKVLTSEDKRVARSYLSRYQRASPFTSITIWLVCAARRGPIEFWLLSFGVQER